MKIKHRIFLMLLFSSLVPLYIFGYFMIQENDKNVEDIMDKNLETISNLQILDINDFCTSRKENMNVIGHLKIVQDLMYTDVEGGLEHWERDYVTNILSELKNYNQFVESVTIIDRDYQVVASSECFDVSELSGFEHASKKLLTGEFYISNIIEKDGKKVVAAVLGIEREGELIGYIVEEIDTAFFEQNRTGTNFKDDGTLYLVDGNSKPITAGSSVGKSREQFVTSKNERSSYDEALEGADIQNNPYGRIQYEVAGTNYITYYSRIDSTDWIVMVSLNLDYYQQSKKTYRYLIGLSVMMVSLLLAVVNHFVSNRIADGIGHIVDALEKVKREQDYGIRIVDNGRDEISVLSQNINGLLDYIQEENLQEKERQRHLARKAERDSLTGVNNRQAIEERLQDMIENAEEAGRRVAVGFLDVDDFKGFNTKYGHQKGDYVLRFVAAVLKQLPGAMVGRYGGDEFIFGIDGVQGTEDVGRAMEDVRCRLKEGVLDTCTGLHIAVPCSVGVVIAEGDGLSYSRLIHSADEAMYYAKNSGKNAYRIVELTKESWESETPG